MPIEERYDSTSRSSTNPTDETVNNVSSTIPLREDSSTSFEVDLMRLRLKSLVNLHQKKGKLYLTQLQMKTNIGTELNGLPY